MTNFENLPLTKQLSSITFSYRTTLELEKEIKKQFDIYDEINAPQVVIKNNIYTVTTVANAKILRDASSVK